MRSKDPSNPPANQTIYYPLDRDFHLLFATGRVTTPCSYFDFFVIQPIIFKCTPFLSLHQAKLTFTALMAYHVRRHASPNAYNFGTRPPTPPSPPPPQPPPPAVKKFRCFLLFTIDHVFVCISETRVQMPQR